MAEEDQRPRSVFDPAADHRRRRSRSENTGEAIADSQAVVPDEGQRDPRDARERQDDRAERGEAFAGPAAQPAPGPAGELASEPPGAADSRAVAPEPGVDGLGAEPQDLDSVTGFALRQ